MVKALFADAPFRRRVSLAAVNSINWARILAQTVYYVHAYLAVTEPGAALAGKQVRLGYGWGEEHFMGG